MTNAEQDIKIARIDQKVDSFKETVENFIQEMRDRDNKRDADIRELRKQHEADMKEIEKNRAADSAKYEADMKELRKQHEADMKEIEKNRAADNAKYEADMKELRTEIHAATRDIRNFTIASVVGIGAIVVGVLGFIANSIFNPPQPQYFYQPPPAQTQNFSGGEQNDKPSS